MSSSSSTAARPKKKRGDKRGKSKAARSLSGPERHLALRFTYGLTPEVQRDLRRLGASTWFDRQLSPHRIADKKADQLDDWWPSLARTPQDLWQRTRTEVEPGWEVMEDYQRWLLMRRLHSRRQVLEVMTEFWEGHLHVPVQADGVFTHRVSYGKTIREGALGKFSDLLFSAITHPAMGMYLNNAESTAKRPNENLGRELLELHTVGHGVFSEADVKASARILTGWRVDMWKTFTATYSPDDHATGPVSVLGFHDANQHRDGRALTRRYLDYLARHPATARRIAHRLAVKFVRDDPPRALVDSLAKVYLANDTAIVPVLRALVA